MTYPPRFAGFRCRCGAAFVWYFEEKVLWREGWYLLGRGDHGKYRRHRCSECGRSPTWERDAKAS